MIKLTAGPVLPLLALSLALAPAGCARTTQGLDEGEIALFAGELDKAASVAAACQEIDALCRSTGFGCQAHELFCRVPTKEYICQQLAAACSSYPAACDVYNNHCDETSPTRDAGLFPDARPATDADPYADAGRATDMDPYWDAGQVWDADPYRDAGAATDMDPYRDAGAATDMDPYWDAGQVWDADPSVDAW